MTHQNTYELGMNDKSESYIRCLFCGRKSFHPADIEHHYCGFCHIFHDNKLSWMIYANKRGKYEHTYRGFRIYCVIEGTVNTHIENKSDGQWRVTEFKKGLYMAIDKFLTVLDADNMESLAYKIDEEIFQRGGTGTSTPST